jgi:hypothetical protein
MEAVENFEELKEKGFPPSGRHNSLRIAELDGNVIGLWAKS